MKVTKHILLAFIFLVLLLPLAQKKLDLFIIAPLDGDVQLAPNTKISTETWFSSQYQDAKEKYLNDNFGFRNLYVRLRNEVAYFVFNKLYAREVVAGKSGFLYEVKYLQTHAGMDYITDEKVKELFDKLAFVQDTLQKQGITFAILFAPGKASYYPEYIPAPYDNDATVTNYIRFSEEARKRKINHIDFNSWFMQMKAGAKYPLYPQTGTHWSVYGMHMALDSLSGYMQKVSGRKIARFDYSDVVMSDSLRDPDGDIARGLNLLHDLRHFTMAYPIVKWKDTSGAFRPNVLTVADSYWMGVYFLQPSQRIFSHHEFWYYNKFLYNYDPAGKTYSPFDYDLKSSIEKNNFIFIMSTEATLKHLGWGIVDELYNMYKGGKFAYELSKRTRKKIAEINQVKYIVWNDEKWFAQAKKQAKDLRISLDSCITMNAEFYYNETHKNDPPLIRTAEEIFQDRVLETKVRMTQNKEWYSYLVKKSTDMKITLDSCLNMDAVWTVKQDMYKERLEYFRQQIKNTPNWLKDVEAKAKKWNISLDSCINLDAKWMAEEEMKKQK